MSQPPYDPNWPPEPDWGGRPAPGQPGWGQQPPYPDQPSYPTQPMPPYQPPPSYPTQPMPAYQPPYQQQPPYQPPPYDPPGFRPWDSDPSPWGPPPPPRRSRSTLAIVLAIVGVVIVGGAAAGFVLLSGKDKKHNAGPTTAPTRSVSAPATQATPDFPSGSPSPTALTDVPLSTGAETELIEQGAVAQNAETVLHAIGDDDAAAFCPLIDPRDLRRLLHEKDLTSCNEIKLKSSADSAEYKEFTVEDPTAIEITGDTARIPSAAIKPTTFGAVDMRKDSDGNWKFRFYSN